jgi:hypothetical protein
MSPLRTRTREGQDEQFHIVFGHDFQTLAVDIQHLFGESVTSVENGLVLAKGDSFRHMDLHQVV